MCSTNHSNWVTFEDDSTPLSPPQKPLQSSQFIKASVPRPNGLKLVLPPIRDTSWSLSHSLESPQSNLSLSGSFCVPCNTSTCTPISGGPSSVSPFHTPEKNKFCHSLSSTSTTSAQSPAPETFNLTSDGPSPFPSFQENSGHYNPFWDGSRYSADVDSSSSDSEAENSLPRFFIRTKDGSEPPRGELQSSFSYVCHKLQGLRAETDCETEIDKNRQRHPSSKNEILSEVSSLFVPRGLFRSQKRDGWPIMLRIPEKKNRMSSRQWGPIYLRLLPGGVLQMYYEKGLEKPFKEFQLFPQCRVSELKLETYSEPRKVLTIKVEHFSYTEKKRYHPKLEVSHEAEVEQLLKFGSTVHDDIEDLVVSIEEEIFKLGIPHQQRRHYEEQELSLQITDHIWVQLDKFGEVIERTAFTQIHCLAFLNGLGDCFLALNDLGLLRLDSSYGSEEGIELWMEIADYHFHKCVNETEFQRSRLVKFTPPDACRVELMRYKTTMLGCTEFPFSVKAVVTVQGAYVELQAFLNMSPTFLSTMGGCDTYPLCENIVIRVPVPGDWVKVTQTVALLRQRSLKARMNRNACLGAVNASDSQPVMQVSIGTVKYENVYSAIVWRIDRLPAKNMAVNHPHSFSCKLELGSDQEIPNDWYPFVTMECEIMGAVVSQTRVKSLGTVNDIQPQKHLTSWTRYHCQAKLYLSIIDDVIESMRELFLDEGLEDRVLDDLRHNNSDTLATFSLPTGIAYPVQIPAGVTLQTASGQLYKVNVPVVVTQAPVGQHPVSQPPQKITKWREACAPPSAAFAPTATHSQEAEPSSVPANSFTQPPQPKGSLPPSQESSIPLQLQVSAGNTSQLQEAHSPQPEVTLGEKELSPEPEPVKPSMPALPCSQLPVLDFQIQTEDNLTQAEQLKTRDIDDILKEVIEEEREKAERARNLASAKSDQSEAALGLDLDFSYSEISDIVQLDGLADSSDIEEEEGGPLEENDFLGIINAEAIKALQEGDGTSDGGSISSSSDSARADELADVEEEDPLNSGDDVIEQDIPDLFDTENVIVCQYDKIHRSKNRWKFHLKDGVMCYGGRDYVFSKAVGEAEW
ncbi:Stonin-1 Stoned B-like factor [Channa argus]|uniref:Stonin-1 Stoned B-like factor n=2 Tax=Channa argus TaxID=215402 RepID=A0A6G1R0P7_CHAAH|nr:Stonin-1 Stoned B-like factor [Channa argus]